MNEVMAMMTTTTMSYGMNGAVDTAIYVDGIRYDDQSAPTQDLQ